jgi:hypothetical protein
MAAARFTDPIEAMTLGDMRANGVRSLLASCHKCHHEIIIEADHWLDRMEVSSFGLHIACTKCGTIGADVRPNGRGQPPLATLTGAQWR